MMRWMLTPMVERHPVSARAVQRLLAALLPAPLFVGTSGCGGCVQSVVENSTSYKGKHYRVDMDPVDAEASRERFLGRTVQCRLQREKRGTNAI